MLKNTLDVPSHMKSALLGASLVLTGFAASHLADARAQAQALLFTDTLTSNGVPDNTNPGDLSSFSNNLRFVLTTNSINAVCSTEVAGKFRVYISQQASPNHYVVVENIGVGNVAAYSGPSYVANSQDAVEIDMSRSASDMVINGVKVNGVPLAPSGNAVISGYNCVNTSTDFVRYGGFHFPARQIVDIYSMGVFPVEWGAFNASAVGDSIKANWEGTTLNNVESFRLVAMDAQNKRYQGSAFNPSPAGQAALKVPNGDYMTYIEAVDNNGEIKVSPGQQVNVSSSKELNVYPNPTSGLLHLSIPLTHTFVVDSKGVVTPMQLAEDNTLDISGLQPGMYVLKGRDGISTYTRKIVKN